MIAEKMKDIVKNSSAIRALFEEGMIMAKKYGAENIYDFSLGNPLSPPPESVKEAIVNILETESPSFVHGYMTNSGYGDVRERVAASLNKKFGTAFDQNNIIMTVGAAGALNIALKTLLNPGDEVVIMAPFFGEYVNYILNFDGQAVVVPPNFDTFGINFDGLEKAITKKTKAILVNSPNNPTGAVYSEGEIKDLAALLTRKQRELNTSIYLLADEPYRELIYGDYEVPYLTKYYNNTFVGYSYSKALSLPGDRIGYLVVPKELDGYEEIWNGCVVANRILGYVNAPSLMQRVIGRCLEDTADFSLYVKNREVLYRELTRMGYSINNPKGTFYMFPKCLIPDDKEFCTAAKEYRLIIVPGSSFGGPGYFRIAFCVPHATVLNSLDSFEQLAKRYGK